MAVPLEEIDQAIAACLADPAPAALDRVAALGPQGLRRVNDRFYGGAEVPRGEVWRQLLFMLAVNNPQAYMDEVEARRVRLTSPTYEIVILGLIDDPRAVALLIKCCRHRDRQVRFHAVRGLAERDEAEAVQAVERAAREDCDLAVRVEATGGAARRDRARAREMYRALLKHPHLTPGLRTQICYCIDLEM